MNQTIDLFATPSPQTTTAHPAVWRGRQCPNPLSSVIPSGVAELDQRLPAGGWPGAALTEVFSASGSLGLSLLAPTIANLSHEQKRWIMWIAPPHVPYAPGLEAWGINADRIIVVHPRTAEEHRWAIGEALRAGSCSMVLSWVDALDTRVARKLQLAAESTGTPCILFRPRSHRLDISTAALRIDVANCAGGMAIEVLKSRGRFSRSPRFVIANEALSPLRNVA